MLKYYLFCQSDQSEGAQNLAGVRVQSLRGIRLSASALLVLLALLAVLPLYSLPSSDTPAIWFFVLIVNTAAIFFLAEFYLQSPSFPLQLCLFIFVFQDILIGILNPTRENPQAVVWLLGYTTLLPGFVIVVSLFRNTLRKKLYAFRTLHLVILLYTVYMLFRFVSSSWPLAARLPAFRNVISITLLFYAGYLGLASWRDVFLFNRFVFLLTLAILAFGYVELFLLGDAFWVDWLNIDYIAKVKHLRPTLHSSVPVPSDFYTPMSGQYYRRMASFFATPITLGYFLAYAFFFTLYLAMTSQRSLHRVLLKSMLLPAILAALFLTWSKGAWQILGVGLSCYFWIKIKQPRRFSHFLAVLIGAGALSTLVGYWLFAGKGTTLELHVQGLITPIRTLKGLPLFIGHSIGSGGAISGRLGVQVPFAAERGAESGIGTLLYQTGFIGVFLYLAIMILLLRALFISYQRYRREPKVATYLLIALATNAGLLVNAFFQENAFALIPASAFLTSAGVALNLATTHRTMTRKLTRFPAG